MSFDVLANLKSLGKASSEQITIFNSGGFNTGISRNVNSTRTVTGQATSDATKSASFVQNKSILDNILAGLELPNTFRESVFADNQIKLGQASVDISQALSDQVKIREQQRQEDNNFVSQVQNQLNQTDERLSRQLVDFGNFLNGGKEDGNILGKFGADIQEALTGNRDFLATPFGAISTTTLLIGGGILAVFLLKR